MDIILIGQQHETVSRCFYVRGLECFEPEALSPSAVCSVPKHQAHPKLSLCYLPVCSCRSILHWDFEQIQTLWSGAEQGWFHMQHQQGVWSRLAPQRWGLLLDSLLIQTCLLREQGSDPHQPSWILISSGMPPLTQCMHESDACLFKSLRGPYSRSCLSYQRPACIGFALSSVISLFSRNKTWDSSERRCDVSPVWRWSVSDGQVR